MKWKSISIRRVGLIIFDIMAILVSSYGALWIRFNGGIESYYLLLLNRYIPIIIVLTMTVFISMKFYSSLWLYASIYEVRNIILANNQSE